MSTTTTTERDWTKLPHDLVGSIAQRLMVVDYIRFGTICTAWTSVVALGGGRRPQRFYRPQGPQPPWLMLPGEDGEFSDTCTFFSLSDNNSYKITSLPELHGKWWVGSAEGWVVTLDVDFQMCLLNPLTRAQIQLPSILPSPKVSVIHDDCNEDCYDVVGSGTYTSQEFRSVYIKKVVFSFCHATNNYTSNSSSSDAHCGYTAMAIIAPKQDLAFTQTGKEEWTTLSEKYWFEDIMYHKGKFYCVDTTSEVHEWDLRGPSPKMTIISKGVELPDDTVIFRSPKYLVESSGDLLQVWRDLIWHDYDGPERTYTTSRIRVFKFDPREGKWNPLSSLDDRCLFLGNSRSMSFPTRDIPGLMCNCIHLTDSYWDGFFNGKGLKRDMGVFNLEDGSFKSYHSCDSEIRWPAAMWFIPNPF